MQQDNIKSCTECVHLTDKAKTSFLCPRLCEESPCKLNLCPRIEDKKYKLLGNWAVYSFHRNDGWCQKYKVESSTPFEKCDGCGFNLKDKCFLHTYPQREFLSRQCKDYDKNPIEIEIYNTKAYKNFSKNFQCRFGAEDIMPITQRMAGISMTCCLCEGRGGTPGCPLVDGYTLRDLEVEVSKEIGRDIKL